MQISKQVPIHPSKRSKWETYFLYIAGGITLLHVACIGIFWTGTHLIDWVVCVALYFIRMFAITGGYHRYFSHRTYKTSRWFQFILAFIAETYYVLKMMSWVGLVWDLREPPREVVEAAGTHIRDHLDKIHAQEAVVIGRG